MQTCVQIHVNEYDDGQGCNVSAVVQHGHGGGLILAQVSGRYILPNNDDVARVIGDAVAQYLRHYPIQRR
jgi:hypothetical protein